MVVCLIFFVGGSRLIANNDINTSLLKLLQAPDGYEGFDFDGSQAFNVDFTLSIKAIKRQKPRDDCVLWG